MTKSRRERVRACKTADSKMKAWVSNYPPLHEWLQKIHAQCDIQIPFGANPDVGGYVEQWQANGRIFFVIVRALQQGWDILTPCYSNEIAATLEDAEKRLGLS